MSKQGNRGQPAKNYRTSWGKTIDGLTRQPDGRWRDQQTGKRWTEPDERAAVAAFLRLKGVEPTAFMQVVKAGADDADAFAPQPHQQSIGPTFSVEVDEDIDDGNADVSVGYNMPESAVWAWLRQQVADRPEFVAAQLGVSVTALRDIRPSPTLAALLTAYKRRAASHKTAAKTVAKTIDAWADFCRVVGAATADGVAIEKVLAFRTYAESRTEWGDKTRGLIFGRVKAVVGAAAKEGVEVARLLSMLKVLEARAEGVKTNSTPMPRETFQRLLDHTSTSPTMRAMLLLGLNCCMYLAEVVALKWSDVRPDGTIVCRRGKTSIIRAAVLWPETIAALAALPRQGNHVLRSKRGAGYHVESARKLYAAHRKRCDVAPSKFSEFASIRDAAYTVSSQSVLMQKTLVLAGHAVGGLSDSYIARNPEYVAEACEAVRNVYIA